jgi:hypothetical protein
VVSSPDEFEQSLVKERQVALQIIKDSGLYPHVK